MSDDSDFKIKRKKVVNEKELKENPIIQTLDKVEKKKGKRDTGSKRKKNRVKLPKYEPDSVVANILSNAVKNPQYFKPMQMIFTEGKNDLVICLNELKLIEMYVLTRNHIEMYFPFLNLLCFIYTVCLVVFYTPKLYIVCSNIMCIKNCV